MKKIVYLAALLICYHAQATLGDAVDFLTKVTQEYSKKESEQCKKLVVIKKDTHLAKKLGWEFINGFSKTIIPASAHLGYRISVRLYDGKSLDLEKLAKVHPVLTILSMGICLGDIIDVCCSLSTQDTCCGDGYVRFSVGLKDIANVAGSVTAVAMLVMMTSAKK